jgi:hypothetical protein
MRVAIRDHFGKSHALARALVAGGHELVGKGPADVLLIDLDDPGYGYTQLIDHHRGLGAKVLLYPHGASPMTAYDGLMDPYEGVDGNLVVASGHAEVMRRMEYPTPTHVLGWSLCPQVPFRRRKTIRSVLFAPTHPSGFGHLLDHERELNAAVFAQLLDGPWKVTVRAIGTPEQNGLWEDPRVRWVRGDYKVSWAEIDRSDVVVAGPGTFPSLSVARGVPTVIYGQGLAPNKGEPGEQPVQLRHGARYHDFMRYPFDMADGPVEEVLHAAARSDAPIADWRRRFVGESLDPAAFCALVERLAYDPAPPVALDATRAFTTVAFADELLERPELLRAYADRFTAADDASLVVWGPAQSPDQVLATVSAAVDRAGLDAEALPDVLLVAFPGSPEADACLARRATAVLSDWPGAGALGALPRFGAVAGQRPLLRAA